MEGAEWQQADKDRQRPGEQDHPQRQTQSRQGNRQQLVGGYQQAEDQEHADLRQPGQAVEHMQDAVARADRLGAQQQAAWVCRQNAAAATRVGHGEDNQPAADHQQRIQPARQLHAVDQLEQQPAATQAEQRADAQLQQQGPVQAILAAGEDGDQGDGEKYRHRVVAARLDFQGGADPLVKAAPAEQGKYRRSIGGADDGPDQQALH